MSQPDQARIARLDARAEALEDCADHLELSWTFDVIERKEGDVLAQRFRREAKKWRLKAAELRLMKPYRAQGE